MREAGSFFFSRGLPHYSEQTFSGITGAIARPRISHRIPKPVQKTTPHIVRRPAGGGRGKCRTLLSGVAARLLRPAANGADGDPPPTGQRVVDASGVSGCIKPQPAAARRAAHASIRPMRRGACRPTLKTQTKEKSTRMPTCRNKGILFLFGLQKYQKGCPPMRRGSPRWRSTLLPKRSEPVQNLGTSGQEAGWDGLQGAKHSHSPRYGEALQHRRPPNPALLIAVQRI